MNREHQLAYDNQSPDESMTEYEVVHEALADELPGVPEWLLDAMTECLVNDDAAYMQHQLAKHFGDFAQKAIRGGDRPDVPEATEYRDMALQTGNTDIQVSESAYYPPAQQERRND